MFIAEGEDLVGAAIRSGAVIEDLLVREGVEPPVIDGVEPIVVAAEILDAVSTIQSGTRILAVIRRSSLPAAPATLTGVALALCGVGDPGNVGTLLRSAAAFAVEVVVLGAPAADPTSPRAVRSAMGATFVVPTLAIDDVADAYPEARLIALDGGGSQDIAEADLSGPIVLALGAEREGLPAAVLARAAAVCRIPQSDAAESLNVAAAGAIALALAYRSNTSV